ncbi:hypothetical protein [Amycolatopsis saalfeldensis]|uniref:Uncharacterized protein n=1 Tax=Amycolatopsis saalfeldensis TaxID=394193 RepID=A0A1H8YJX1_9PSEU|nr:hypothetical protein [Amycolatopsis saalfeldensis]SEP51698.1 hypothetical protein SAMN04489732_11716 [Amycolatopsis saalfeldensis]
MTGAADRLAAARSAMESATREHQEQRGLRERHLEEAKAQARQSMERDAAVHGRYITHMQELNRRHKEAGGWLTEKTLVDRWQTMEFGPEEDDKPRDDFGKHIPPKPPGPIDAPILEGPPPATQPVPAPEPSTTPIPPPASGGGRHGSFDDDDFSNNSWMVD